MICNVIFDIGNVFVQWSPEEIVERTFRLKRGSGENARRAYALFRSSLWTDLNRGRLTMQEAEQGYREQFCLSSEEASALLFHTMNHLEPVEGTEALATRIKAAGYRVFAITDTVHEIVSHLRSRYQFYDLFDGVVTSAEFGTLKPDLSIFRYAIERFDLDPAETVFFDDVEANIDGARMAGMVSRLFTSSERCAHDLRHLGLRF